MSDSSPGAAVEVRVLGPVSVSRGGTVVSALPTKHRTLLARLALSTGTAVSVARLVDDLWGERPPESAVNALQVYVSALRKRLGPDVIATQGRSYRLGPQVDVDSAHFEAEVTAGVSAAGGDDMAADAWLRRGLRRWTGQPLDDLDDAPFVTEFRAHSLDIALTGHETWAAVRLRRGEARAVVADLHPLCRAHPFREGLRAQLVVALAACGRQAEAFAEYECARSELADEFGADPGEALRTAYAAVLHNQLPATERTPATSRLNLGLREDLASFVGRDADLDRLEELCRRPDVRLVTVVGPGGVGKTRLAQEVVTRCSGSAAFVALLAAQHDADVAATAASALGIDISSGAAADAVLRGLSEHPGELLLVFDNFEHVLPAAQFVARLVRQSPHVTVLVTSRTPLGLAVEHRFPLDPLPTQKFTPGTPSPAAMLFLERTRQIDPRFVPDDSELRDAQAVADLCEGLPLALEIAAARTSVFSLPELRQRLERPLQVLVAPGGTAQRRSSVRASIEWSVDQLTPIAAATLQACTVFHGGFTVVAVADVAQLEVDVAAAQLGELLDHSLLRASTRSGRRRFELQAMVRAVVVEHLDEGAADDLKDRHVSYFARAFGPVPDARHNPNTYAELAVFDGERANLRAAIRHAASLPTDVYADLIVSLANPWATLGPLAEIEAWLLDLCERDDLSDGRRLDALTHLLKVSERTGGERSAPLLREAQELAEHATHERRIPLIALAANAALNAADVAAASMIMKELDSAPPISGDPALQYAATTARGMAAYALGDNSGAVRHFIDARDACRPTDLDMLFVRASFNLSETMFMAGDAAGAAQVALEALPRALDADADTRGGLMSNYGTALLLQGDTNGARAALRDAAAVLHASGSLRYAIEALMRLAAARAADQPDDIAAARLLGLYQAAMELLGFVGQPSETALIDRYLSPALTAAPDTSLGLARIQGHASAHALGPAAAVGQALIDLDS